MNNKWKQAYKMALKDMQEYYGDKFIPFDSFEPIGSYDRSGKTSKQSQRWS